MSLLERWRDERFHRNLAKIDEQCLHEQIRIDARKESDEKWQAVVAKNKAELADNKAVIEQLRAQIAELQKK